MLFLAGFIYSGSGSFPAETDYGASLTFTFFSTALADDGHGRGSDGWNGRGNEGGRSPDAPFPGSDPGSHSSSANSDPGRPTDGPSPGSSPNSHSSTVSSDIDRPSYAAPSSSSDPGSHSSVSYDAGRNMMTLGFRIGERDRHDDLEPAHRGPEPEPERHWRHEHEFEGLNIRDRYFRERERRELDNYLRDVMDRLRESQSSATPAQSVNPLAPSNASAPQSETTVDSITTGYERDPVATSYQRSPPVQQNDKAVVGNTRFAIGNSAFMPNEVLAVGLDPASIERAKAMGFRADPQAVVSKASNHIITRFTVPPGLDAVQGQDLLSRKLPGHRFQLNKVYRFYRAAMSEDKPGTPDKDKPAPAPDNISRCGSDRCFAWQAIGWKATLGTCARGMKVGVIDTDIDESHPTFAGRSIHRFDFSADGHGVPPNSHGTAVLSLLAGNPVGGTPGLIPDAEFFAANIFFSDERGEMAADTISLLKALDWMKSFGVKLVNMSFSGPRDELVAEAIEKLSRKGIVFVAAAGNEGPTAAPSYPAAYPQVIAVTAVTKDLRNYRYANRGDHIDVAAPGVDIWTAMPGGRAGYNSGTSFAAPHVTAILAVEPQKTLQLEKAALLDGLPVIDLGQQGRDPVYGRGLLKAPSECAPAWETTASNE